MGNYDRAEIQTQHYWLHSLTPENLPLSPLTQILIFHKVPAHVIALQKAYFI